MIFVQKLPTLDPEMRDALRCHIMRKRQRLKQEMEQDAIEKRLKREKELKQLQDAMTLDQIKEQLSSLEKRLESLKDEKHHLFNQLKQVLNEDTARRKQNEVGIRKNGSDEARPSTNSAESTIRQNQNHLTTIPNNNSQEQLVEEQLPIVKQESFSPRFQQTSAIRKTEILNTSKSTPLPVVQQAYSIPVSMTRPILNNRLAAPDIHNPFRPSVPNVIPEILAPQALNYSQHTLMQYASNRPLLMDAPTRILSSHDTRNLPSGSKRSLSVANINDEQLVDRSLSRKKSNYVFSDANQFLMGALPHDIPHRLPNMSQYNPLMQHNGLQPPLAMPVPSSSPSFIQNNLQPRKPIAPHHLTSLDYINLMNQNKPGIILPNLVHPQFYAHPQHLIQQNGLYSMADLPHQDLNHFNTPFASIPPQYSNSIRAHVPHPNQPDQSQYLAINNHQRKHSQTKNPYYHNK